MFQLHSVRLCAFRETLSQHALKVCRGLLSINCWPKIYMPSSPRSSRLPLLEGRFCAQLIVSRSTPQCSFEHPNTVLNCRRTSYVVYVTYCTSLEDERAILGAFSRAEDVVMAKEISRSHVDLFHCSYACCIKGSRVGWYVA